MSAARLRASQTRQPRVSALDKAMHTDHNEHLRRPPSAAIALHKVVYGGAVCEALWVLRRWASVEEVFLSARELGHPVSFATTYSTLVELARRDLVTVQIINRRRRRLYLLQPEATSALTAAGLISVEITLP